jgi:hypothetical protein
MSQTSNLFSSKTRKLVKIEHLMPLSLNSKRTRLPRKKLRLQKNVSHSPKRKLKFKNFVNSKRELTTDKVKLMLSEQSELLSRMSVITDQRKKQPKKNVSVL